MDNKITGVIAALLVILFLGFYAVKLASIPLWIIILAILAMVLVDFYESTVIKGDNNTDNEAEG